MALHWYREGMCSPTAVRPSTPHENEPPTRESAVRLCHALIRAGLVDEYRLFVYPVVQGRGRRLFPDGFELPKLKLLEAKAFRSGIIPLN